MISVRDNYETIVPAGNELGKDFISALTVLWFFVSRRPCKIVTTAPHSGQLEDVLWGEIRRFIQESKYQLPIQYNHMHIRQTYDDGTLVPNAELVGRVVQKGESMLGRHVERTLKNEPTTLLVVDEASGVDDLFYEVADTWTHRKLVIGNPYPCANFFRKGVKEGDLPSERSETGEEDLYRKVIRIRAADSPNVRLAHAEIEAGRTPSHEELIPGMIRYADYVQRRNKWDPVRQCIGLDAEFYEGEENLLFPPEWLNHAETMADKLFENRPGVAIGVDPAEGKDSTAFSVIDHKGLIEQIVIKTPDTSTITSQTLALMKRYSLNPKDRAACNRVCFDRGGGGKQHADRLRSQGYPVRTVGFGEAATKDPTWGTTSVDERREMKEVRYTYRNKRAEMYGRLSLKLEDREFAIPKKYSELRNQLSVIPRLYDEEGRLKLPPKGKKSENSKETCLIELIGHSPDEADSLVLALHALETKDLDPVAGSIL